MFFILCLTHYSRQSQVFNTIHFIFEHLIRRCNPLATWAFLPREDNITEFGLTFGTVELDLVIHIINVQPLRLLNEYRAAIFIGMNYCREKLFAAFLATVFVLLLLLFDRLLLGLWLLLHSCYRVVLLVVIYSCYILLTNKIKKQ